MFIISQNQYASRTPCLCIVNPFFFSCLNSFIHSCIYSCIVDLLCLLFSWKKRLNLDKISRRSRKPDNENESESEIEIEIDLYKFVLLIHLRIHNLIKSSLLLLFVKNTIRVIFSNGSKIKNCCFYVFFFASLKSPWMHFATHTNCYFHLVKYTKKLNSLFKVWKPIHTQ